MTDYWWTSPANKKIELSERWNNIVIFRAWRKKEISNNLEVYWSILDIIFILSMAAIIELAKYSHIVANPPTPNSRFRHSVCRSVCCKIRNIRGITILLLQIVPIVFNWISQHLILSKYYLYLPINDLNRVCKVNKTDIEVFTLLCRFFLFPNTIHE